jgi:hypothetical protein
MTSAAVQETASSIIRESAHAMAMKANVEALFSANGFL